MGIKVPSARGTTSTYTLFREANTQRWTSGAMRSVQHEPSGTSSVAADRRRQRPPGGVRGARRTGTGGTERPSCGDDRDLSLVQQVR